jgi:hypothetical protein
MVISTAHLSPLLSILFGILILIFPRLLNYLVAVYLILAGLLGIGLIGTPLRAHTQLDHGAPGAAVGDCRSAANVAATSIPANIAHDSQRGTRMTATPSRGRARRVASLAAGDAEYPFSASRRVALVMKPARHP